jgi:hypothetical protein
VCYDAEAKVIPHHVPPQIAKAEQSQKFLAAHLGTFYPENQLNKSAECDRMTPNFFIETLVVNTKFFRYVYLPCIKEKKYII